MKATKEQCQEQAKLLAEMKPRILRQSRWGEDNHKAMDAQIAVLSGAVKEDDMYDQGWGQYAEYAAQDAINWMGYADEEESPAESWKVLVKS